MPPKIIGISGTNGSGKDTIGQLLVEEHNYLFISVTDILREELKKQGLPLSRDQTRRLSVKWRKQFGVGVLVDKAKQQFDSVSDKYQGLAIASLRNPGEADSVHALGGVVLWVDGDPKVRYRRIASNRLHRGADRAADDEKTYEGFLADEEAEMYPPKGGDETTLSMSGVKEKSDLFLINNGNDLGDLSLSLNKLLGF